MTSDILPSGVAGTLFGSALTASGVYLPSVILSQFQLKDFHMLEVFLTASSASALAVALYERLTRRQMDRRAPSNLGWLGPYDGNIIGGAMIGAGMVLTGACPGTVLVQVGTGIPSGRYAIVGGVLGGILYTSLAKYLRRAAAAPKSTDPQANNHALPAKFGIDHNAAVVVFEGMVVSMIVAAKYWAPSRQAKMFLDPVVGGLLIGGAQLATLILTKSAVGVSTCYEDIGRWFWGCLGCDTSPSASAKTDTKKRSFFPVSKAIAFASGVLASSYALSTSVPEMMVQDNMDISPAMGILGGLVMVFGARLAGGCTSGHGISGMSMLGVSSIITVASMFAGGIGLALAM